MILSLFKSLEPSADRLLFFDRFTHLAHTSAVNDDKVSRGGHRWRPPVSTKTISAICPPFSYSTSANGFGKQIAEIQ